MNQSSKLYRAVLLIALVAIALFSGLGVALDAGVVPAVPAAYEAQATSRERIDWAIVKRLTVQQSADFAEDFQFTADKFTVLTGSQIETQTGTNEGVLFAALVETSYDVTTTASIVIPANAYVVDWQFIVTTAYTDTGTDLMNCGTTADPDRYVDDLSVATAGINRALDGTDMQSDELANWGDVGASDLTIQCVYTGQNGDAAVGAGAFTIWYRLD